MDLREIDSGSCDDNFWHKSKAKLVQVLFEKLNLTSIPNILDIGCGAGEIVSVLKRFGGLWVNDVNKSALMRVNLPENHKLLGDFSKLSVSKKFDVITMLDVLEHIEDDRLAIKKAKALLNPGGFLVVTVPALSVLFSGHDRFLKHFRRYDHQVLKRLLGDFNIIYSSYWNFFLFSPFFILRLLQKNKEVRGYPKISSFENKLFYKILCFENFLIKKGFHLPIGVSLIAICRKD